MVLVEPPSDSQSCLASRHSRPADVDLTHLLANVAGSMESNAMIGVRCGGGVATKYQLTSPSTFSSVVRRDPVSLKKTSTLVTGPPKWLSTASSTL